MQLPGLSAEWATTDERSGGGDVLSGADASRLAGKSGSRLPQSKALGAALYAAILNGSEISNFTSQI